jgi:hypothetical protein
MLGCWTRGGMNFSVLSFRVIRVIRVSELLVLSFLKLDLLTLLCSVYYFFIMNSSCKLSLSLSSNHSFHLIQPLGHAPHSSCLIHLFRARVYVCTSLVSPNPSFRYNPARTWTAEGEVGIGENLRVIRVIRVSMKLRERIVEKDSFEPSAHVEEGSTL